MKLHHPMAWLPLIIGLIVGAASASAGEADGIFSTLLMDQSRFGQGPQCHSISGLPEVHLPQVPARKVRLRDACDQVLKAAAEPKDGRKGDPTFGPRSFWIREGHKPRPIASCADNLKHPGVSECVVASKSRSHPGSWFIALTRLDGGADGTLYNEVGPFYGSDGNAAEATLGKVSGSLDSLRCGSAGICYARRESFQLDRVTGALHFVALHAETPQDVPDARKGIVFNDLHWHSGPRGNLECQPYHPTPRP